MDDQKEALEVSIPILITYKPLQSMTLNKWIVNVNGRTSGIFVAISANTLSLIINDNYSTFKISYLFIIVIYSNFGSDTKLGFRSVDEISDVEK